MKAKTMTVFFRGKTMIEDANQIFRRNANAIIDHGNFHVLIRMSDTQGNLFFHYPCIIKRVFGVPDQVH